MRMSSDLPINSLWSRAGKGASSRRLFCCWLWILFPSVMGVHKCWCHSVLLSPCILASYHLSDKQRNQSQAAMHIYLVTDEDRPWMKTRSHWGLPAACRLSWPRASICLGFPSPNLSLLSLCQLAWLPVHPAAGLLAGQLPTSDSPKHVMLCKLSTERQRAAGKEYRSGRMCRCTSNEHRTQGFHLLGGTGEASLKERWVEVGQVKTGKLVLGMCRAGDLEFEWNGQSWGGGLIRWGTF